ncbi:MAG: alpha/beta hydrolase [Candidatus Velamenicoccus archaeovorus]
MDEVRFTTEDGVSLEGELRPAEREAVGSAVLCHALPTAGGSKDHPIPWAVRNELAARGFAVLSFNFRGVMRSGGTYGGGRSETRDVAAALGLVRERVGGPTLVFGWSFGANVALREAIDDPRASALALVGIPLGERTPDVPELPPPEVLRRFRRPVLLLSGQGDTYSPRPDLELLARRLPASRLEIVPGTDHFLWRREKEAAGLIGAFAAEALGKEDHTSARE